MKPIQVMSCSLSVPEGSGKQAGVAVAIHRIANGLADRDDVEITVATLSPKPVDARYAYVHLFPGRRINRLLRTHFGKLILFPLLLNFVRFPKYDVIHFHGCDWFFLKLWKRTIRTMYGSAKREAQFTNNKFRKILLTFGYALEWLSRWKSTKTLALGPDTKKIYGLSDLIDIPYDEDLFEPGEKSEHPMIFYNGYWHGRKRGEFMFRQFTEHVIKEVPDAILHMVSDTAPTHEAVVLHEGGVDNQELASLYRKAWVFAYPSTYEGFGLPYVEAMASSTPVVTSRNQGAEHVLQNGKYGDIADDDEFAERIISLLKDRSLAREGAERARTYVKKFTVREIAEEHMKHYCEVCKISAETTNYDSN